MSVSHYRIAIWILLCGNLCMHVTHTAYFWKFIVWGLHQVCIFFLQENIYSLHLFGWYDHIMFGLLWTFSPNFVGIFQEWTACIFCFSVCVYHVCVCVWGGGGGDFCVWCGCFFFFVCNGEIIKYLNSKFSVVQWEDLSLISNFRPVYTTICMLQLRRILIYGIICLILLSWALHLNVTLATLKDFFFVRISSLMELVKNWYLKPWVTNYTACLHTFIHGILSNLQTNGCLIIQIQNNKFYVSTVWLFPAFSVVSFFSAHERT